MCAEQETAGGTYIYIYIWPWAKYPITKSGHRKEIGGGVCPHAGFTQICNTYMETHNIQQFLQRVTKKIRHSEHSTKFSSPAGPPPARKTYNFE